MSAVQKHRIGRQLFEVQVPDEVQAKNVYADLSALQKQRIEALIDRCCSELSPADRVHRIGRLEVDLGTLSGGDFERQVLDKLESALRDVLARKIQAVEIEAAELGEDLETGAYLELLSQFARTGTLPYWADESKAGLVDETLGSALERDGEATCAVVRWLAKDRRALLRLVQHVKAERLLKLFRLLVDVRLGATADARGNELWEVLGANLVGSAAGRFEKVEKVPGTFEKVPFEKVPGTFRERDARPSPGFSGVGGTPNSPATRAQTAGSPPPTPEKLGQRPGIQGDEGLSNVRLSKVPTTSGSPLSTERSGVGEGGRGGEVPGTFGELDARPSPGFSGVGGTPNSPATRAQTAGSPPPTPEKLGQRPGIQGDEGLAKVPTTSGSPLSTERSGVGEGGRGGEVPGTFGELDAWPSPGFSGVGGTPNSPATRAQTAGPPPPTPEKLGQRPGIQGDEGLAKVPTTFAKVPTTFLWVAALEAASLRPGRASVAAEFWREVLAYAAIAAGASYGALVQTLHGALGGLGTTRGAAPIVHALWAELPSVVAATDRAKRDTNPHVSSKHDPGTRVDVPQQGRRVQLTPPGTNEQSASARVTPPGTNEQSASAGVTLPGTNEQSASAHVTPPGTNEQSASAHVTPPGTNEQSASAHVTPPGTKSTRQDIQRSPRDISPPVVSGVDPDVAYVNNAGLILFWPFLDTFFTRTGLMVEHRFVDIAAQHRAIALLHHLVTGTFDPPEYQITLTKILCGIAIEEPFASGPPLTESEIEQCAGLLQAFLAHAPMLGEIDVPTLRNAFLLRKGLFRARDDAYLLSVERAPYDMVLEKLPWPISWIRFPWMQAAVCVEWLR